MKYNFTMKKFFAILCALVLLLGITPDFRCLNVSAESTKNIPIGPAQNKRSYGSDYLVSTEPSSMFEISGNPNNGFSVKIKANTSSETRTGKITVKNKKTNKVDHVDNIVQRGIVINITASSSSISANGQTITWNINTNMPIQIYSNASGNEEYIMDFGTAQTSYTGSKSCRYDVNYGVNLSDSKKSFYVKAVSCNGDYSLSRSLIQDAHTHSYTYMHTNDHLYTRKCTVSGCTDCDNNITYREYLNYTQKADNETNRKKYIIALGYDEKTAKDLTRLYNNYTSTPMDVSFLTSTVSSFASTYANLVDCTELDHGVVLCNLANDTYNFFTANDETQRASAIISQLNTLSGMAPGVSNTVGNMLTVIQQELDIVLPRVIKAKKKAYLNAMLAHDVEQSGNGKYIGCYTSTQLLTNPKDVTNIINTYYGGKFAKEQENVLNAIITWRQSYELYNLVYGITESPIPEKAALDFWAYTQEEYNSK